MPNDNKPKNDSAPPNGAVPKIQSGYTHTEYKPEDFSQLAINRGQRRINYEVTSACQKLSEALALLTGVVAKSTVGSEEELARVKELVTEATVTSSLVASIKPPGCDPGAAPQEEPKNPAPSSTTL